MPEVRGAPLRVLMEHDKRFRFSQIYLRRRFEPSQPWERKRPKMPSGPWRLAAVICFSLGAAASWMLFRDTSAATIRTIAGGVAGFVVGMYIVETLWERRYHGRGDAPPSPIGKRR